MKPEEIKELIKTELASQDDDMQNIYGVDLVKCLVEPVKQQYLMDDNSQQELWTVLEESSDGYRIFFDEEEKMFGLGMVSKDGQLSNVGYHGSFLKTLEDM